MIDASAASPQKLRGGYYTDPVVARWLRSWALGAGGKTLLEPSCGDGAFLDDLPDNVVLTAIERDPVEAERARARAPSGATVHTADALELLDQWSHEGRRFDAVVGNPPYIRYQYLSGASQDKAAALIVSAGLKFTRHTNAWVPFVVGSLGLLKPGGRLAMVIPSELLHVLHAGAARHALLGLCSRVHVLDPSELWFADTLQGVVLLLAERGEGDPSPCRLGVERVRDRSALDCAAEQRIVECDADTVLPGPGKWTRAMLSPSVRGLLRTLETDPRTRRFTDVAKVQVGVVTGANAFFLVDQSTVDAHGLASCVRPMFGRSSHVRGVIYSAQDHEDNRQMGLPCWFVDMPDADALEDGHRRWLAAGEAQDLPQRYKCRIRSPWWRVPSVFPAPVGLLKRSHDLPRLVDNRLGALSTDTAYRVFPQDGVDSDVLVSLFLNPLTALSAELEGRHYGGGVLELVPSEIRGLRLPWADTAPDLDALDRAWRGGTPAEDVLNTHGRAVLERSGLGDAADALLAGWRELRARRQRSDT